LGCTVLIDQWIAGRVSATFMLGTALVLAGLCTGLFAVVAAMGLALSMIPSLHCLMPPVLSIETVAHLTMAGG
jgi:hypothetical protein